jgi:hypothetical protein
MPRIGVVCEGKTDKVAIEWYVRKSLVCRGFDGDIAVCRISDHTDRTSGDMQGYTRVLAWLSQPLEQRQRFFVDLFGGNLGPDKFDAIVVHLDADNLSTREFRNHVRNQYGMNVRNPTLPERRGFELRRVIMSVGDLSRSGGYAIAAAVESTETWCLSSFRNISGDPESISGNALVQKFMESLHIFENRPTTNFNEVDKDSIRWERFCRHHSSTKAELLERQCYHYRIFVSDLVRILVGP